MLAALRKVRAYFVLLNLNWPPSPVGKLEYFIDLGQSSLGGRGSMVRGVYEYDGGQDLL